MSSAVAVPARPTKRREDFPVDSFKYLEAKLQLIRKTVMNAAAEIADRTDSHPDQYRVERHHVDHALAAFFANPVAAQKLVGARLLEADAVGGEKAVE